MPDQVSKSFWQALLVGDSQTARNYATQDSRQLVKLPDPAWKNASVSIGEIRIKGENASVETIILPESDANKPLYTLLTYLVKENGAWKVDYRQTQYSLPGSIFEGLIKSLQNLGDTFTREIEKELPLIGKELDSFGLELKEKLDEFGRELEKFTKPKKEPHPGSI